jgi:hypothetical protein
MSEKEELREIHAAQVHQEIHELLRQLYHASNKDLEKLDNLAFSDVLEKHPEYSTIEKIELSNVAYLHNLRNGVISGLLGKRDKTNAVFGISNALRGAIV